MFKIIYIYQQYTIADSDHSITQSERDSALYASFMLAATLWCTLLIIYRIWSITRRSIQIEDKKGAYHHIIEALVESSALYSTSLILYIAFYATNSEMVYYSDVVTAISRVCIFDFIFQLI